MSTSDTTHALEDIAVRDIRGSTAIDEPMRTVSLDKSADEMLTASEMHEHLVDRGIDRTENTVRPYVNALRGAGLAEIAHLNERRRTVTRHYHDNTILLSRALRWE